MAACPECQERIHVVWRRRRVNRCLVEWGLLGFLYAAIQPLYESVYERLYPSAEPSRLIPEWYGRWAVQGLIFGLACYLIETAWAHTKHPTARPGIARYLTLRLLIGLLLFCGNEQLSRSIVRMLTGH